MADKTIINADIGTGWSAHWRPPKWASSSTPEASWWRPATLTFVYLSGRTATDGDSDVVVGVGDIKEQTRQVIRNLLSALEPLGGTIDDIVRVRVFMTPPFTREKFGAIHDARAEFFNKDHYPASTLVDGPRTGPSRRHDRDRRRRGDLQEVAATPSARLTQALTDP